MKNQSNAPSNTPSNDQPFFTAKDENLQNLEILLTSLAGEDMSDLPNGSASVWNHLEELEHQVWATFFPASYPYYAAEHRMTMSRHQHERRFYLTHRNLGTIDRMTSTF